jgi:hypothetical protein
MTKEIKMARRKRGTSLEYKQKQKSKAHTRYRLADGTIVPGITTITSICGDPQNLINWANRIGLEGIAIRQYVDELATIGTLTHYLIECFFRSETPDLSDYTPNQVEQAQICFQKFLNWEEQHDIEVVSMEVELVSEKYRYGGRGDVFCKFDGEMTYIDFKTAKWCFLEHKVQGVANKQVYEEVYNEPVPGVRILRVGRSPAEGFEDIEVPKELHERMWQMFLLARKMYDERKFFKGV